jgi:hypothetical protein
MLTETMIGAGETHGKRKLKLEREEKKKGRFKFRPPIFLCTT